MSYVSGTAESFLKMLEEAYKAGLEDSLNWDVYENTNEDKMWKEYMKEHLDEAWWVEEENE